MTLHDSVLSVLGEVWATPSGRRVASAAAEPERPKGSLSGGVVGASLDHALWLHRPFRADEWFLYDCLSPSASGARGLATGRMFTREGQHIATAVQEGLLRKVGAAPDGGRIPT